MGSFINMFNFNILKPNYNGSNIVIIFDGELEPENIDDLSDRLAEIPCVTEYTFDSVKNPFGDGTPKCTVVLISINQIFPFIFASRFEKLTGGHLEMVDNDPYAYAYRYTR